MDFHTKYNLFLALFIFFESSHISLAGWGEPQLLNSNINSNVHDYFPWISADGKVLYFVSDRAFEDDIYVSRWDSTTNDWGSATRLNSNVNTIERELSPSLSPDGKRLYFVRYGWLGGYGSYDIWYSDWDTAAGDWGPAKNAGPNINSSCIEWSVGISRDGKKLFYSSGYNPAYLTCDYQHIFLSEWDTITGWWGKGRFLEAPVNKTFDSQSPSLAGDDTTLYFASWDSHNDTCFLDFVDIFVAYFNGSVWYIAKALCPPVNTSTWDHSPSVTPDERFLYFASRRSSPFGSEDNIYVSEKTTAVKDTLPKPAQRLDFRLYQNYPNPFNSSTMVKYSINQREHYSLVVYNLLGQRVITLFDGIRNPGVYEINWTGVNSEGITVTSGIYFLFLKGENDTKAIKLTFLK